MKKIYIQYWKFFNLNFEQDGSRWKKFTSNIGSFLIWILNSSPYKGESHDLMSCLFCFVLFCFVCHTERSVKPRHFMLCTLGIFRKLSMTSRCALTWFETVWSYGAEAIDYWTIFSIKIKSKPKSKLQTVLEFEGVLYIVGKLWEGVRFIKVYFTISRAKVWKILIFEWILLLKIQTNYKNWVWTFELWTEKSVEPSTCSHLGQWHTDYTSKY